MKTHGFGLLGGMVVLVAACATGPPPTPSLDVKACPAEWSSFAIGCGVVRVPEDYAVPDGRSIALNVAVLRAAGASDENDAQFELAHQDFEWVADAG